MPSSTIQESTAAESVSAPGNVGAVSYQPSRAVIAIIKHTNKAGRGGERL